MLSYILNLILKIFYESSKVNKQFSLSTNLKNMKNEKNREILSEFIKIALSS